MYIVVIGGGRVGYYLSKALLEEGHEVLILEKNPAVVEVVLKNEETRSRRVDFVKGNPKNPMTMKDVEDKFKKCLPFAVRPLQADTASAVIGAVKNLESIDDISEMLAHLN